MKKPLKFVLTAIGDGLAVGLCAGVSSAYFLIGLAKVTHLFKLTPDLLWALPIAGLCIAFLYQRFGGTSSKGNHLIIDEIHEPKAKIPVAMAPLIFVTTIITHLFGGSAGREGSAVQMGASLADVVATFFRAGSERRRRLLICGMGAGFGAAIGTPLAGAVFGMEVLRVGRLRPVAVIESLVAAYMGHWISHVCHAPHSVYPVVTFILSTTTVLYLLMASVMFGFLARLFIFLTHSVENLSKKLVGNPLLRPFIAGILLIILFRLEGTGRLNGLGLDVINDVFRTSSDAALPFLKSFFTALTIGSGFKGGEFTPLAYIGATAGSAIAAHFPVSVSLFAACGFSAVFGAASKTPIACAVMAAELFGLDCFPLALLSCLVAHHCAGMTSIYHHQKPESLVLASRIKKWITACRRSGNR